MMRSCREYKKTQNTNKTNLQKLLFCSIHKPVIKAFESSVMASFGQQKFCANTPHFFKIILEDTSRDHKLKIPKKFVIKYGEDLSNSVCLKLPSGSEWQVELTRSNCETWFGRGWPEFSRFCSLEVGTFIVFRYEGNSKFDVCIFDTTATEIDYPLTMPNIKEVETREKPPLVCPPLKKMRRSWSGKAISENGNTQPYDTVVFEKPMSTNRDSHCSKAEIKKEDDFRAKKDGAGGSSSAERFLRQTRNQQVLEKAKAFQRANAFKSENPTFLVAMLPSYIQSTLSLPLGFSKRHLTKQPDGNIILRVSDGRTWPVEFTCREQKAQFEHGWLTFVKDNNLEVGDVCVFILIKDIKLLLRVFLFRTSQAENWFSPGPVWRNTTKEGNGALSTARRGRKQLTISDGAREFSSQTSPGENDFATKNDGGCLSSPQRFQKQAPRKNLGRMKQLTTTEKAIALQRANAFKSDNPFFKMAMQPSHIHENKIDLPYEFAKRHLIKLPVGIAILRVSDGDTWSVRFKYDRKNSKARLLNGWSPFVRDNNLKVGDVCVFVLIDRNEFLFEVFFFPTIEAENCSFSPGHGRGASVLVKEKRSPIVKVEAELNMKCEIGVSRSIEVKKKIPKTNGQVTRKPCSFLTASSLEAANKFVSENPFFIVTLGSYHKEKSNVSVPASFVKSFIKGGKQTLKLQVEDKSWPVNLITYGKHSAKFSGGWAAFATEHCLKEGDVCIFELMEMNDFLLKVHILHVD